VRQSIFLFLPLKLAKIRKNFETAQTFSKGFKFKTFVFDLNFGNLFLCLASIEKSIYL